MKRPLTTRFENCRVLQKFPDYLLSDIAGNPLAILRPVLPARFFQKVKFQPNGCWLWIGAKCSNPKYPQHEYGKFWDGERVQSAHRYAYEVTFGQLLPGFEPDHLCNVKLCVNPSHLEALTHQQNCALRIRSGPAPNFKFEWINGKRRKVRS